MASGRSKYRRDIAGRGRKPGATPATNISVLIVVEGEETELAYFEGLHKRLNLKANKIKVLHTGYTDPVGIVRAAIQLRDEQAATANQKNIDPYDQTWVVFDREKQNHERREQMPVALTLAGQKDIQVALSIPCFEFWLLLHFDYLMPCADGYKVLKKALKQHIPDYEKSNLPLADLFTRNGDAVKHAKRCRKHWEDVGGDRNPSTEVDLLVSVLNESARSNDRLF